MILAVVVVLWTLQPHTTWELVGVQRSAKRPSLLRHMFVCVTFAWQPHKIVYLKQAGPHFPVTFRPKSTADAPPQMTEQ